MPEIFRIEGFVFFFYTNEGNEPIHIHVRHAGGFAKFWLEPLSLEYSQGMKTQELTKAEQIIKNNLGIFLEKWNEKFRH